MSRSKPKDAPSEPTRRVADRLHSTAIHLLRRVRRGHAVRGAGPGQLSALSLLVLGGPLTLGQLAVAEQVKAPTMTRIVTASGIVLFEPARKRRIDFLAHGWAKLTSKQLAAVDQAVEVLNHALMRSESTPGFPRRGLDERGESAACGVKFGGRASGERRRRIPYNEGSEALIGRRSVVYSSQTFRVRVEGWT